MIVLHESNINYKKLSLNLTLHVHERQTVNVNVSAFVKNCLTKYSFSKNKTIGGNNNFEEKTYTLFNNTITNEAIT
jgi:hypothetical protein